jgi:ComF family protein
MTVVRKILDLFFPRYCVDCNSNLTDTQKAICHSCFATINIHVDTYCLTCRARIPESTKRSAYKGEKVCHPETPWPLVTATSYKQESVAALIKQLKFYDNKEAAAPLGRLAAHALKEKNITQPLILVPVPLGKKRKRQRGYNQAERIAKEIALLLRIPVKTNILFRIRETKPQTEMSSSNQRQNNIEKCFRAIIKEPKIYHEAVIVLVDDVVTTGQTAQQAARALQQSGIKNILVLTPAIS